MAQKYIRLFIIFCSICLSTQIFAQAPWTATLYFGSRPTPYLEEWRSNASIGTLTILNPTPAPTQIIIIFEVRNLSNNTVMLRGRSSPQNINAFPSPTILTNNNFIGSTGLQYNEAHKVAMIRTGMMPEGEYQICLTFENISRQPIILSQNICSNFSIAFANPPQLINPQNNSELERVPSIFNWTPVVSPTGGVNYELKIVEVLKGQSPTQALQSNIPIAEDRTIKSPTFLLPPDLANKFRTSASYGWRVRAVDAMGKSFARNEGYSEIFLFSVKGDLIVDKNPKPQTPVLNVHTIIKGVLKYGYADPEQSTKYFPLANMPIHLSMRQYKIVGGKKKFFGNDSTYASSKTDAAGNFTFSIDYKDAENRSEFAVQNSNTIINTAALIYRKAFLIVDDIHYTSPDVEVKMSTTSVSDAGEMHCFIKSFGLTMSVNDIKVPYGISGAVVDLYRLKKDDHIPNDEGSPKPSTPKSFLGIPVIAEGTTDGSGNVNFGKLIQCYGTEQYVITITPPSQFSGYEYAGAVYPDNQKLNTVVLYLSLSPTMNSDYTWSQYHLDFAPQSIKSGVKGNLHQGFDQSKVNNTPLTNTALKLQIRYKTPLIMVSPNMDPGTYPDNGKVVAFAKTDSKGDFSFTFTDIPKLSDVSGLTRMYKVIVDDKHFSSPDEELLLQPGEIRDIGVVYANLRTYTLKIHTQKIKDSSPLPGMYVYVRRPNRPIAVPDDEGSPHPDPAIQRSGEDVVAVGLTGGDDASVTFTRLARCYNDFEAYHFETVSDPTTGKNYLGFSWDDFSDKDDFTEFNSEYQIPFIDKVIKVIPLPAQITGRVLRDDNHNAGIANALVTGFYQDGEFKTHTTATTTDNNGYYYLDGKYANQSNPSIQASKLGYSLSEKINLHGLQEGEQQYTEFFLMPKAIIKGKVFAKWGESILWGQGAYVTVENGSSVLTYGDFSLPTNLEEPSHVFIDPVDASYFNDTIRTYHPHASEEDLGNVYMLKKLHRIKILTIDQETNEIINSKIVATEMANPQFPGSVTPAVNWGADTTYWTPFESSDQYFTFTTYTNTDADYEHRAYSIKNPLSKDFILYKLKTRKAGFIKGTVYLYSKKSGKKDVINSAKIHIKQATSQGDETTPQFLPNQPGGSNSSTPKYTQDEILAYSGFSLDHLPGVYKLGNVPIGKHTFFASKSKSGTIGEEKTLTVPKEGLTNVDFFLQVYEDMDITQMLGFPMNVEKLDSLPNGVFITGSFSEIPSSQHFKTDQSEINFTNISITPGIHKGASGVPYPKPVKLPIVTDESSIPLWYTYSANGKYNAQLKGLNGNIVISSTPDEKGTLSGKIYIPANQFSPKISFINGKENGFYLAVPNQLPPNNMNLSVLPADGNDAFTLNPNGLKVVDMKGSSGNFTLNSFNAAFDATNSVLQGDSITIATTLNLPDISNSKKTIPLNIGIVRLRGKDVAINLPPNITLPEIALDNWKLQGQNILFSGDNFSMDGVLKTGSVDVPFTGLPITPQGWKPEQAAFKLSSLSIASVIPLALNSPVQFGHDIGAQPPAWQLYSTKQSVNTHAASFAGINGMTPDDSIFVSSFKLTSLGSNSFNLQQNVYIHLYKYMSFLPQSLSVVSGGVIDIKGDAFLDLGYGLQASNRVLSVFSSNGSLVFDPKKLLFDIQDYYQNGKSYYYASGTFMTFPASAEQLNENGFFANGTLIDQNPKSSYSFPVLLSRTPDSTAITIQSQSLKGTPTIFSISKDGARYVGNIIGGMEFDYSSHKWSTLRFSGSLMGLTGASSTMTFKISGAVQTDGDQQIAVKNIPTPFGGGAITIDFATGAMHGSIDLNADLPGAGHMDGQADLQIDKDGWYFAANGDLQINNPNIGIQAALVLGSYPNILSIDAITGKFNNLPWKQEVPQEMRTIPTIYNTLSGFFFAGDCTGFLGINLPSIDVDLDPIVHCSVSAYYGAALSLGMNFAVGTQFDIGAAAFVGVDANAGGSIGIACGGGSLHVGLNMYGTGSFNTSTGNWSITGSSNLILSGEMYAGWGVCSSSCGWYTCDKHSWGPAQMSFGLIGFHVDNKGFKITY